MIEFNYEQAKAGKPICTRDGRPARIICWDKKDDEYPIVALIQDSTGEEFGGYYNKYGKSLVGNGETMNFDLMMTGEKKHAWINIYREPHALMGVRFAGGYTTFDDAIKDAEKDKDYICTKGISWEE